MTRKPRETTGWVVDYIEHGDIETYSFFCDATDADDANSQCLESVEHCEIVNTRRD